MTHSLEVRVPLMDVELIKAVAPLIWGPMKPDKKAMAKAAWGEVPSELLSRPKNVFSIPTRERVFTETEVKERGLRGWARVVYLEVQKYRTIH